MADQATVRGAGQPAAGGAQANGNTGSVVGGIAEFGNDVATLAELQAKLAALDLKDSYERALVPILMIVAGLVFAVASLPVLIMGIAIVIARALELQDGWMMVLVSLIVMASSALMAYLFLRRLPHSFEPLRRSREELTRNLAWVRTVLVHSGRAYPRRRL